MKLSDYVANFLADQGIRHVFVISGGASLHLIHSIADTPNISFVCTQHEQAAAMAADAYARVTGNLGAAIATSGPGATNLITGVCCAYYDSVPSIFITGQVSTFRMKSHTGVRQIGFQETDTVNIFEPITKYAVRIDDPRSIRYELEKAVYIAKSGRPGPVLIDIPDNIQREEINADELPAFIPAIQNTDHDTLNGIDRVIQLMRDTERPVIILGWGIRLSKCEKEIKDFIREMGFPVAPTWGVADLLPSNDPLFIGTFGTHGTRYANFAVQNADLILSIGARLDTKATGSPMTSFGREAKKIIVDIDPAELNKFQHFKLNVDVLINADAKEFLQAFNKRFSTILRKDVSPWLERIRKWKLKYPICPPAYYNQDTVNPYVFVKSLSKLCQEGDILILDTGCALAWVMQAFDFKSNQRLYHDWNNTAMGWALPASIAACMAMDKSVPIICITGDGSLQMNIQELATVLRHQLPIRIFLINNHGYSMIQQTQDQWLGARYLASSVEGGLAFPDFVKVAKAYGFKTVTISKNEELHTGLQEVLTTDGPVFCNIEIRPEERVIPLVKYGRPNEDAEPLLERNEFLENMIIKPLDISLNNA